MPGIVRGIDISHIHEWLFSPRGGIVVGALLIFLFFWFANFPPFVQGDGVLYSEQAWLLAHGKSFETNPTAMYDLPIDAATGKAFAPFPIGLPLLILPFLLGGINSLFIFPLLVHLLTFGILYLLFKRWKIEPLFALWFLFFPYAVFQAQRIMSEAPSVLFMLMGIYFLESPRKSWIAGIFFGIACAVRYPILIFIAPWLVLDMYSTKKEKGSWSAGLKDALPITGIIAAFVGGTILFNLTQYGHIFGYDATGETYRFGFSLFLDHAQRYVSTIVLGYNSLIMAELRPEPFIPYLVIAALAFFAWEKKEGKAALGGLLLAIIFFSLYQFDASPRFLYPALIFSIAGYALIVQKVMEKINAKINRIRIPIELPILVGAILLLSSSAFLLEKQSDTLQIRADMARDIYAAYPAENLYVGNPPILPFLEERMNLKISYSDYYATMQSDRKYYLNLCHCTNIVFVQMESINNNGLRNWGVFFERPWLTVEKIRVGVTSRPGSETDEEKKRVLDDLTARGYKVQ